MAVVAVTGNVWDHTGAPIPAASRPELWFRPASSNVVDGSLVAGVEARATLAGNGAFVVQLVAFPGVTYRPTLRWLTNPSETKPELWAFGHASWGVEFDPYPVGGNIGDLMGIQALNMAAPLVSLDPPPPGYRGLYLNAPGPGFWPGDPDDPESSVTGILEMVV